MATTYFNAVGLMTGINSIPSKGSNPIEGDRHGSFVRYKDVNSYDILAGDDQDRCIIANVTDWNQILVVVPDDGVITEVATLCESRGAEYYYEDRVGFVVLNTLYNKKLQFKLIKLLRAKYGDNAPVNVQHQLEAESDTEDETKTLEEMTAKAEAATKAATEAAARAEEQAKEAENAAKESEQARRKFINALEAIKEAARIAEAAKAEVELKADYARKASEKADAAAAAAEEAVIEATKAQAEVEAIKAAADARAKAEAEAAEKAAAAAEKATAAEKAAAADSKAPGGADWHLDLDELFSMFGAEYGKTPDDIHHQETETAADTEDDEEEDENAVNAEATAEAAVADSKAPGGADWHLDLGDLSDFK